VKGKRYFLLECLLGAFLLLLTACGSGVAGQATSGQTGGQSSSSSGQTSSQQTSGPSIVGTWTGNCPSINLSFNHTEFRDDGTVVINNVVAKYSLNGDQLQLSAGSYTVEYSFTFSQSGNIFKLSDSNGNFCAVVRDGSNAVQESSQALVGVWTGQSCTGIEAAFSGFMKIDIHSDGTALVYTPSYDSDHYNETYSLQDAGTVVFSDNLGNKDSWAFWVSDSSLMMQDNTGGYSHYAACSFQKSA
jgi:hypothetical protein